MSALKSHLAQHELMSEKEMVCETAERSGQEGARMRPQKDDGKEKNTNQGKTHQSQYVLTFWTYYYLCFFNRRRMDVNILITDLPT